MRGIAAAAGVMAALAGSAPAHAGTVHLVTEQRTESDRGGSWIVYWDVVVYDAAPAEVNDVELTIENGVATVRDTAGVEPGPGCGRGEPVETTVAICRVRPHSQTQYAWSHLADDARVTLLDGDDRIRLRGLPDANTRIDGGAGDDRLQGGAADDVLIGAGGDDWLEGGGGYGDRLQGGAGADELYGSEGTEVDYTDKTAPVDVDLDGVAPDGEAGEGDVIGPFVTAIRGGAGPDRLVGNDRSNYVFGGPGGDLIVLHGGPDGAYGEGGRDLISGGPGDEFVLAAHGEGSVVSGDEGDDDLTAGAGATALGGPGRDKLHGDTSAQTLDGGPDLDEFDGRGGGDTIRARDGIAELIRCDPWPRAAAGTAVVDVRDLPYGCARVERDGPALPVILHRTLPVRNSAPTWLRVTAGCPDDLRPACTGAVRFTARGRLLGSGRFRILPGRFGRPSARVDRYLTRLLSRERSVIVEVRLVTSDSTGRRRFVRSRLEFWAR